MKKIFIWFCGTGTDYSDMFNVTDLNPFDKVLLINGVGTEAMFEKSKNLNKKSSSWLNALADIFTKTGTLYEQAFGYNEKSHIVSALEIFDIVDYLQSLPSTETVELTLGGHSRGAAVGLTVFLAGLNQTALYQANPTDNCWRMISKINLVPVDPVPGGESGANEHNDLFGSDEDMKIEDILCSIEQILFNGRKVFNIFVYSARFDTRNQFCFDKNWLSFVQENVIHPTGPFSGRTHLIIAGFRHSAMIYKSDEISSLYKNLGISPITLLEGILHGKSPEWLARNSSLIRDIELGWLQQLSIDNASVKTLKDQTALASYGIVSQVLLSGTPLIEILKNYTLVQLSQELSNTLYLNRYIFR